MYQWQSMLGKFEYDNKQITFHGETAEYPGLPPSASIGNLICDQRFSGGTIEGKVRFTEVGEYSACQFIVSFHPATNTFLTAGIGSADMFVIGLFFGKWTIYSSRGD